MHLPPRRGVRTAIAAGLVLGALHSATPSRADAPRPPLPGVLTGDPTTQPVPLEELVRAGMTPMQAVRSVAQRELVSLGVPRESFRSASTSSPSAACTSLTSWTNPSYRQGFTTDVGDLDGNRRRDVVETHGYDDGKRSTGYVVARDARTGKALWSRSTDLTTTDPVHEFAAFGAVAAHVGTQHAPGVLLVRVKVHSVSAGSTSTTSITYDLTGLDGRGRQVWHSSFTGRLTVITAPQTVTFLWKDFPWAMVVGHFRPRAEDLVLLRLNSTATGVRTDLDRYALDTGRRSNPYGGSPASLLSPVTDVLLPGSVIDGFGVVPDQTGDGREDLYVVKVLSPAGEVVSSSRVGLDKVVVLRGDTGAPVWEGPTIPRGRIAVVDAGVLTQESRLHDIAVVSSHPVGFSPAGTGQSTDRADGTVLLLKGGTGALAWAMPGASVFPMQRFRGQRALGVVSVGTTTPAASGKISLKLEVDVRDGMGQPVATVSHLMPTPESCSWFQYTVTPGMDLTHDTSPDLQVWTSTFPGSGRAVPGALALDGATGKELDRSQAGYLEASVNGAGLSRLTWAERSRDMTFYVRRGDKVTSVLAKVVVPRTPSTWTNLMSLHGTGSKCADLLTVAYTPSSPSSKTSTWREVQRLLGANGKPWWTLTVDVRHPLGIITTGKGAKDLC